MFSGNQKDMKVPQVTSYRLHTYLGSDIIRINELFQTIRAEISSLELFIAGLSRQLVNVDIVNGNFNFQFPSLTNLASQT